MKKTLLATCLASTILLSGCNSKEESIQKYVDSGIEFYNQGDLDRSRVQLQNALQIDPKNVKSYEYLSKIAQSEQNWKSLYINLLKIEKLQPTDIETKLRITELLLMLGGLDEIGDRIDFVLQNDPKNVRGYLSKAMLEVRKNDPNAALSTIIQGLEIDPNSTELLSIAAGAYHQMGDDINSLKQINDVLSKKPKDVSMRLLRIRINETNKNIKAINEDLKALVGFYPDNSTFTLMYATRLRKDGRSQQALDLLRNYVDKNPDNLRAVQGVIDLTESLQGTSFAKKTLDAYVSKDHTANADLKFYKIQKSIEWQDLDEASKTIDLILNNETDVNTLSRAQTAKAQISYIQGDKKLALSQIQDILNKDNQNTYALQLRAVINLNEGNLDSAISDLRVVSRNNPDDEAVLNLLGRAYMTSGSSQLADDSFRKVLKLDPGNSSAALPVAGMLIQTGDLDRAEDTVRAAIARDGDNNQLLATLAQIKLLKQDWAGAESVIGRIDQSTNQSKAFSNFLSGQIFQGQNQYDLAIAKYKAALEIDPTFTRALEGIAYSYIQNNDRGTLLTFIDQFISEHSDIPTGYLVKSGITRTEDIDLSIETIKVGIKNNQSWSQGYAQLAALYGQKGDSEARLQAYAQGMKAFPDNIQLKLLASSAYQNSGDLAQTKSILEDILDIAPNTPIAKNNLAVLLLEDESNTENISRAVQLASGFADSNNGYLLDTYGWALYIQNSKNPEALFNLKKAHDLTNGSNSEINYHYAMALTANDQNEDALTVVNSIDISNIPQDLSMKISELKVELNK